jgi:hypothetical protein
MARSLHNQKEYRDMSFCDFFTPERVELAGYRTLKNIKDAQKYACAHSLEAALVVGAVFTLAVFFPAPVLLGVCLSALALIAFNLFKEPTLAEGIEYFLGKLFPS